MPEEFLLILTTAPDAATAERLAQRLLERRVAACVSMTPRVTSLYRWQGVVERAEEVGMAIKTTADRYPAVEAAILAEHPYDVPELIALPVAQGSATYLAWVAGATRPPVDGE